jgi:hypothetical protein
MGISIAFTKYLVTFIGISLNTIGILKKGEHFYLDCFSIGVAFIGIDAAFGEICKQSMKAIAIPLKALPIPLKAIVILVKAVAIPLTLITISVKALTILVKAVVVPMKATTIPVKAN